MSAVTVARTVLPIRAPYDLARTLGCGQAFGWRHDGAAATGPFAGHRVRLWQLPDGIVVEGVADESTLRRLRRYLNVDEPLAEIEERLREDRVLRRVLPTTSGIAILRQDPWECLISFIISAFNNIPKIELTLARLTERCSALGPDGGRPFPAPQALAGAGLRALRGCLLGYRAPYVAGVARLVASGEFDLERPGRRPYEEARRMLLALPGVGEKVADCVLLFAYGRGDAFPVDVWVRRAVVRWYFGGRPASDRRIREFARARFGPLAGYAQQHLFHFVRGPWGR